jgi:head-tail adaptor
MLNKLNAKVDILIANPQQDTCGGLGSLPLLLYPQIWASIEDLTGKEVYAAQTFASDLTVRITVRKHSAITSACLVRAQGMIYIVKYVRDPAMAPAGQARPLRGMYQELLCSLYNDQTAAAQELQQFAGPDPVVLDGGSF